MSAYGLNDTQSSSQLEQYTQSNGLFTYGANNAFRVFVYFADGTYHELTDGGYTEIFLIRRTGTGTNVLNTTTWVCPDTDLNLTDCIAIKLYQQVEDSSTWTYKSSWITDKLSTTTINGTWTFSMYTGRTTKTTLPRWTRTHHYCGIDTSNSTIYGVQITEAPLTPQWSDLSPTDNYVSNVSETIDFKVKFDGGIGTTGIVHNMSKARFCLNYSTSDFINSTWQPLNGTVGQYMWFNVSITLTATEKNGRWVKWCIEGNNTDNNFNVTTLRYFYYWETLPPFSNFVLGTSAIVGFTHTYYNGSANGGTGQDGLYVAYLNGTDGWLYLKGYDIKNANFTKNLAIMEADSNDGHYDWSISFLPDSRPLVAWGYYTNLRFRIGTYYANAESNMTKLLTAWGSTKYLTPPSSGWASYPFLINFGSNSTCIFIRDGSTTYGSDQDYARWVDKGIVNCYVKTFSNWTSWKGGIKTSDAPDATDYSPWVDERNWNWIQGEHVANEQMGNWTFRNNDYTANDMYVESYYGDTRTEYKGAYIEIYARKLNANEKVTLWVYNGTSEYKFPAVDITQYVYGKYRFDLGSHGICTTPEAFRSLRIRLNMSDNSESVISSIRVCVNITGFGPFFRFLSQNPTGYPLYSQYWHFSVTSDNKLFMSGELNDYTNDYRRNCTFWWSDNYAYSFKYVDGTYYGGISPFVSVNMTYFVVQEQLYTTLAMNFPVYDETSNKITILQYLYNGSSVRGEKTRVELLYYNRSVGVAGGSWVRKNCTLANNETLLFQGGNVQYGASAYNAWYKRIMIFQTWNDRLTMFVPLPTNHTKFVPVYYDPTFKCGMVTGERIINSPKIYEAFLAADRIVAGKSAIGSLGADIYPTHSYGTSYTATETHKVTGLRWWVHVDIPDDPVTVWTHIAIYNSTLHRIAYTDTGIKIISGRALHTFSGVCSFSSPVNLTEGQSYWLMFHIGSTYYYTDYLYTEGAANCGMDYAIAGNWPATLNPSNITYTNHEITVFASETTNYLSGFGDDPFPPSISLVSCNATVPFPGGALKFVSYCTDSISLQKAELYWNQSGSNVLVDTYTFTSNPKTGWGNFTETLPADYNTTVAWYISAYDNSNNKATSSTYYFYYPLAFCYQTSASSSSFASLLANWAKAFSLTQLSNGATNLASWWAKTFSFDLLSSMFTGLSMAWGYIFSLNIISPTFTSSTIMKALSFQESSFALSLGMLLASWVKTFSFDAQVSMFSGSGFTSGLAFPLAIVSPTLTSSTIVKALEFGASSLTSSFTSLLAKWALNFAQSSLSQTFASLTQSIAQVFTFASTSLSGTLTSLLFSKDALFNLPSIQHTIASTLPHWALLFEQPSLGHTLADMLYNLGRTFDLTTISNTLASILFNKNMQFALSEMQRSLALNPFETVPVIPMRVAWMVVGLTMGLLIALAVYMLKKEEGGG